MNFSLTDIALKRPIAVVMLVISVIGLGVIAHDRTPLKFMPDMDFPFVFCFIPYPGATPEQVEKEIAVPAEGEFRTISHMEQIKTFSSSDGCQIFMRFGWDAEMTLATADVRDRIERLKLVLPKDVDQFIVQRYNSGSLPVLAFGLFRKGDEEEFAHMVRTVLRPRLQRLPGVADVEIVSSKPEKDILVEFDQNALRRRNLPVYQVITQLQTANLNLSVGKLVDGGTKYYVRVLGELRRPEDLAELVVGPQSVRLKDVATVGYRARDFDWHYDIDGKGGAFILIRKESEANTVATCKAVHEELERIKEDPVFAGADSFVFFDQSDLILAALNNLVTAGEYGGLMAVAILFLFLRRIRATLMVALAIPSSLVCAFVFMFFAGMTLNVVTMVSLIVAIGMLVDNSIVVIENIFRYRRLGYTAYESARRGASEVGLAITASTLTTMVVFVPVFYMETGQMSTYMREFGMPMIISLGASLLIALTVLPLAMSRMKEREHFALYGPSQRALALVARLLGARISGYLLMLRKQHVINGVIGGYSRLLGWAMQRRLATMVVIGLLLLASYQFAFRNVGVQQMPKLDLRQVNIELEFDQNFDAAMEGEQFAMLNEKIGALREELGIKSIFTHYDTKGGAIELYLLETDDMPPGKLPPYTTDQVLDVLWQKLPPRTPGVEVKVIIPESEQENQTRGITVVFKGDDDARLNELAEQFKDLMKPVPYLSDIKLDTPRSKQEMQIDIDDSLAEQSDITPWMIARTVDVALRGTRLPYMKQGGREVPVWAQFREEDRTTKANLDNVVMVGGRGNLVPLNELVSFGKASSPARIRRVDGKNVVRVEAQIATTNYTKVQKQIQRLIDTVQLPLGYTIELGEEFDQLNKNISNFLRTLAMAIILIYIVMSALFESFLLPLSILTAVPLSFVGVFWLMSCTHTSLDAVSMIGCILMVGVVVNNGIVIVDHINCLRREGLSRLDAIVQAGRDRFRPVMMTAITTILGCLPLAIGSEFGSRVTFMSLGRALIGGLTTGTLLTLIVVPLFYSFIDDISAWSLRFFSGLASLGKTRPVPEAAPPVIS